MKEDIENLKYLLEELESSLDKYSSDIPDVPFKLFKDLLYHANKIMKGMEKYAGINASRDNRMCKVSRLHRD